MKYVESEKMLKSSANIDRQSRHMFWTTWGISMEWMCLLRISKVTKNQGFTPLFRRYVFGKTARGGGGGQIDLNSLFKVKRQTYKIARHTQTDHRQKPTNCLSGLTILWDKVVLKGLRIVPIFDFFNLTEIKQINQFLFYL